MKLIGELAALATSFFFAMTALIFTNTGRMFGEFSPFQTNDIRIIAAVIFTWGWTAFEGKTDFTIQALRAKPRAIRLIALGALMGPLLSVSSSLLAVQHAEIGVASTLIS